jgi:hypothetical protein
MKRLITLFIIILFCEYDSALVAAEDTKLLEDLPPYRIVVVCSRNKDDYDVKMVSYNTFGQILLIGRSSSDAPSSFLKMAEKMTSGLCAKITSNGEGGIQFEFLKSTAGSALIIIGGDGSVKTMDDLPRGMNKGVRNDGYMFIGQTDILVNLPVTVELLTLWKEDTFVEKLIADKKIRADK